MALSLAMRLSFQDLPFASLCLGGHTIIVRWTRYIWFGRCPAKAPQVLVCFEGCGLLGYSWPLQLIEAANETR